MKRLKQFAAMLLLSAVAVQSVEAGATFQAGHISNVTFAGDEVMIMLDAGTPTNCSGVPFGWMVVPATSKSMQALVLGLWLRGDAAQTNVMVYTVIVGGRCIVDQIDPQG